MSLQAIITFDIHFSDFSVFLAIPKQVDHQNERHDEQPAELTGIFYPGFGRFHRLHQVFSLVFFEPVQYSIAGEHQKKRIDAVNKDSGSFQPGF